VRLLAREHRAREEAEAANRMKDEFLATLSHELRTPLNAVLGWAVTLRTARLDPATSARALEAIERNARAQSQLIEDLLDISRIVSGKLRLEVRIMDPITVVEAAIEAMRPAAASKDLALVATLDPRAGPVWGDPDRLQQVVWNLLSNAIKFTPKGGRVDVRLSQVEASVEIAVSDPTGIKPALLPHAFSVSARPTVRAAHPGWPRHRPGPGAPPGGAARRTVTAESRRIRRHLPRRGPLVAGPADDSHVGQPAGRSDAAADSLAGVRVLVVDDEHDTLEMFDGILAAAGASPARNGRDAGHRAARRVAPDVIVSDIGCRTRTATPSSAACGICRPTPVDRAGRR
jgi:CheY-like chemotaxis protein